MLLQILLIKGNKFLARNTYLHPSDSCSWNHILQVICSCSCRPWCIRGPSTPRWTGCPPSKFSSTLWQLKHHSKLSMNLHFLVSCQSESTPPIYSFKIWGPRRGTGILLNQYRSSTATMSLSFRWSWGPRKAHCSRLNQTCYGQVSRTRLVDKLILVSKFCPETHIRGGWSCCQSARGKGKSTFSG